MGTNNPTPIKHTRIEIRGIGEYVIEQDYDVNRGSTLSDVSLEEGDSLPEDSDYEIVDSYDKVSKGKNDHNKIVHVRAVKLVANA